MNASTAFRPILLSTALLFGACSENTDTDTDTDTDQVVEDQYVQPLQVIVQTSINYDADAGELIGLPEAPQVNIVVRFTIAFNDEGLIRQCAYDSVGQLSTPPTDLPLTTVLSFNHTFDEGVGLFDSGLSLNETLNTDLYEACAGLLAPADKAKLEAFITREPASVVIDSTRPANYASYAPLLQSFGISDNDDLLTANNTLGGSPVAGVVIGFDDPARTTPVPRDVLLSEGGQDTDDTDIAEDTGTSDDSDTSLTLNSVFLTSLTFYQWAAIASE